MSIASDDPRRPRDSAGKSPAAPILLRFFGGSNERAGVNGDYFTVGVSPDDNVRLPALFEAAAGTKMRFSRGAEGWRLTLADEQAFYLNQDRHQGLTPLRSGDVIRLAPGGAGMQFLVRQQQDAALAKLVARHAPRLLKTDAATDEPTQGGRDPDSPSYAWIDREQLPVLAKRALGVLLLIAVAAAMGYLVASLRSEPPSVTPTEPASTDSL